MSELTETNLSITTAPQGEIAIATTEPLLSQLNLAELFAITREIKLANYKITITGIVPITADIERSLAIQTINIIPTSKDMLETINVLLLDTLNEAEPRLAGYATFSINRHSGIATADINRIKAKQYAKAVASLSPHIQTAVQQSELFEAFEITDRELLEKGGQGKNLWLLSAAILELQGINTISIHGDITIGKSKTDSSFYSHLGATPVGDGTQNYEIPSNLDKDRTVLVSLLTQ